MQYTQRRPGLPAQRLLLECHFATRRALLDLMFRHPGNVAKLFYWPCQWTPESETSLRPGHRRGSGDGGGAFPCRWSGHFGPSLARAQTEARRTCHCRKGLLMGGGGVLYTPAALTAVSGPFPSASPFHSRYATEVASTEQG